MPSNANPKAPVSSGKAEKSSFGKKPSKLTQFYGTGRRKNSVARVFLRPGGSGKITINKRSLDAYFGEHTSCAMIVRRPLVLSGLAGRFDVYATTHGGGTTGQADALSLGITRAILTYDEADGRRTGGSVASSSPTEGVLAALASEGAPQAGEHDHGDSEVGGASQTNAAVVAEAGEAGQLSLRKKLRNAGLVTRDSRRVERKVVGRPKARRAKQFSKR